MLGPLKHAKKHTRPVCEVSQSGHHVGSAGQPAWPRGPGMVAGVGGTETVLCDGDRPPEQPVWLAAHRECLRSLHPRESPS